MSDLFHNVLQFEQECQNAGYQEGVADGTVKGFLEGRELGLQTGFQRYLTLGFIQGRVTVWENTILPGTKEKQQIERLRDLVMTADVRNIDSVVSDVDLRIRKGKVNAKAIASATKTLPITFPEIRMRSRSKAYLEDF